MATVAIILLVALGALALAISVSRRSRFPAEKMRASDRPGRRAVSEEEELEIGLAQHERGEPRAAPPTAAEREIIGERARK